MSLHTHVGTLASWITLALVILGCYWYLEDSKREMDQILITINALFEAESKRDAGWMLDEAKDLNRTLALIRELERGQAGILEAIAKTRISIARHQGHHDVRKGN